MHYPGWYPVFGSPTKEGTAVVVLGSGSSTPVILKERVAGIVGSIKGFPRRENLLPTGRI